MHVVPTKCQQFFRCSGVCHGLLDFNASAEHNRLSSLPSYLLRWPWDRHGRWAVPHFLCPKDSGYDCVCVREKSGNTALRSSPDPNWLAFVVVLASVTLPYPECGGHGQRARKAKDKKKTRKRKTSSTATRLLLPSPARTRNWRPQPTSAISILLASPSPFLEQKSPRTTTNERRSLVDSTPRWG